MSKIPVRNTIVYAYTFAFGQLGIVIGLIWIPLVILGVGTYFTWAHYLASLMAASRTGDLRNAGGAVLLLLGWTITGFLVQAIAFVGVTEQALGLRKGPVIARFSVGRRELRVFGGLLSLAALVLLFAILVNVGGTLGYGAVMLLAHSPAVAFSIATLVKLILECAMFFAVVRLGFFIVPIAVAEDRVALSQSWKFTRGSFWRLLAICAAVLLPLLLLAGVAEVAILGPKAFTGPAHVSAEGAPDPAFVMDQLELLSAHLPELVGLSLLAAPFFLGLLLSAQASAYRAVTGNGQPGT